MFEYIIDELLIKPFFSIDDVATSNVVIDKLSDPPTGLILDIRDGTCRDIYANGLDFHWTNTIVIIHRHYDHMRGLFPFLDIKRQINDMH